MTQFNVSWIDVPAEVLQPGLPTGLGELFNNFS
jgi:hypothetical protein